MPCPTKSLASLLAVALVAAACDPPQAGSSETILPELRVVGVGPDPILPGTRLVIEGEGFVPREVAALSARLRGAVEGVPVDVTATPVRRDDARLEVAIVDAVEQALFQAEGIFQGELTLTRTPAFDAPEATATVPVQLRVTRTLTPLATSMTPDVLYPGDLVTIHGDGFLHPSEGFALVRFDGEFETTAPPASHTIAGLVVPAAPPQPQRRDLLELVLTPDIFGVRPGHFTGTVTVVNGLLGAAETSSEPLTLTQVPLRGPIVEQVTPLAASRGQQVDFLGRGLLPPDGLLQATTLLLMEGTFSPRRGPAIDMTGVDALALFPDASEGNTLARIVLRVDQDVDGELTGLGLAPGIFEGAVTPMVLAGPDLVRGDAFPLTFEVLSPRQMVYLKLLPAFDEALEEFGLAAERDAVVARMLEVVRRDYAGVNVGVDVAAPGDFIEFSTVELGGRDPNGTGLFGLDNTSGKDTGNLRFDDVIGGFNAETRSQGYAAYGGIFVAEFLNLSPTLSTSSLADDAFDRIFGPVAPALGGKPAQPDESAGATDRAAAIREAVRCLGNLVGNTVTHEVGHSLGLTAIDGQFHNVGDNDGWIMDSGSFRPFAERAEIDGAGPEVFSPFNREYLERILPVDG